MAEGRGDESAPPSRVIQGTPEEIAAFLKDLKDDETRH